MTRKFHFTTKNLSTLPSHDPESPSREKEYSDTEVTGLRMLVSKNGRKFFYFRYTKNNRKKCLKVGEFPMVTLKEARDIAAGYRGELSRSATMTLNIETQAAALEAMKPVITFKDFAMNEYLPYAKNQKKTWRQDLSRLNNGLLERFGALPLDAITKKDAQQYIGSLRDAMEGSSANRILSLLSRMFKLAVDWEILEANPFLGIKKNKENSRERYLSVDELKRFMDALDGVQNVVMASALKLLLFTGTRKSEILTLTWDNVNLADKAIFLPETKNGEPRKVLLNDLAMELLEKMKAHRIEGNPFVFPCPGGAGHIVDPRRVFEQALKMAKIADFHIHDLRHTYASILVNAGVPLYNVKELLGHKDITVTQRYSHLADASLRASTAKVADRIRSAIQ